MTQFDRCRRRLEFAIEEACEGQVTWPARVAAAVRAAVELAAADPDAGRTLTAGAGPRHGDDKELLALVDRLATLLESGAPPRNRRLPAAPTLVMRIARQINLELEAGRGPTLPAVTPDLTFLALMPYLGFAEARRWSQPAPTA
jgi:hypothetical protein